VEAEFFIKSLGLNLGSLVNIKYLPLLVSFSFVFFSNTNLSSFLVFASNDFKGLFVGEIDELVLLKLEDLPPFRVSTIDLHDITFT
jgi:hypothetical protein